MVSKKIKSFLLLEFQDLFTKFSKIVKEYNETNTMILSNEFIVTNFTNKNANVNANYDKINLYENDNYNEGK